MRPHFIRYTDAADFKSANRIDYLKPSATAKILNELAAWLEELRFRFGQPHNFSNRKYWRFVNDIRKTVIEQLRREKMLKDEYK